MSNPLFLSTSSAKLWMENATKYFKEQIKEKINSQETTNLIINEIQKKITEIMECKHNGDNTTNNQITPSIVLKEDKIDKSNSYNFDSSFDDIFKQITINGK